METVGTGTRARTPARGRLDVERRWVIRDIGWDDYEELGELLPQPFRLAFDGRSLEIMVAGQLHDDYADALDTVFKAVASALGLRFKPYRTASWTRPELERGIQADNFYNLAPVKRMAKAVIKRLRSVNTVDVNSHSLGVKISDPSNPSRKINHIMIPRNTPIPQQVSQKFVTNSANQSRVHVYVLEGEATDPEACTTIGDFRVTNLPPNLPAGSPVEIAYNYDTSGRIHATAKEMTGKNAASMEIVRDSGLDEQGLSAFQKLAAEYKVQ